MIAKQHIGLDRHCDGCRFCCYSWAVDAPDLQKPALQHCSHECPKGCAIFDTQPSVCRIFKCPYLEGLDIYRPDTFADVLEGLNGDIGNYIPAVPASIKIGRAKALIKETHTVPAAIHVNRQWKWVLLPLHRNADGGWQEDPAAIYRWDALCEG